MKRIIIIGEGPTEQAFCNDVLEPFFTPRNIHIQAPTIKKSGGGIVSWSHLKNQIERHLRESDVFVSMLIDYYGIHPRHNFPGWEEAKKIVNKSERMDFLEKAMANKIPENLRHRFIPYFQLHEFEALIFSDTSVITKNFEDYEFKDYNYLEETVAGFDNPEEINDDPTTAPSKRLGRIIAGYNKPVYGAMLTEEIGLERIRKKCPRFSQWIEKLSAV